MAANTENTFSYDSAGMAEIAAEVQAYVKEYDSMQTQINTILSDKLLGQGITGEISEMLSDNYKAEVVDPMMAYYDGIYQYMTSLLNTQTTMDEGMEKARQIVG